MSVEQYQRTVNSLDKEIVSLEKKKAAVDKKSADEQKKAANVFIGKNASASEIRSKTRQKEQHITASMKAANESANLAKKIADKRTKRNDAYIKLQKEQAAEQKKRDKAMQDMQHAYEQRIIELTSPTITPVETIVHDVLDEGIPEQYDVFVSHAWEDKTDFVDEFVEALQSEHIKVWYDRQQIKWGDSMRTKIDNGLKKSKFGIVVLSPNYIAEGKYWTKAELDGLFQLESINGKTLLPVWHNLTKKEVMEYSPIIANKLAMSTAIMTPQEMAAELAALLNDSKNDSE